MKTLLAQVCIGLFALCLGATTGLAQEKMGFVNIDSVLSASTEAKVGNEKLVEMVKASESEFQQMQQEFQKGVEDYQNKQSLLSETRRQEVEQDLGEQQMKLQQYADEKQREVAQAEQEVRAPIVRKVRDIISDLAKAQGYHLILPVALYVSEDFQGDLTQQVIEKLNANYK